MTKAVKRKVKMQSNFKMISLNCEGGSRNKNCIKYILETESPDFLCIQESWLLDNRLSEIESLDRSYLTKGKSGVDPEKQIIIGRPQGGLITMYKSSFQNAVNVIPCSSRRLYVVKLNINNENVLIANVYMPCDRGDMYIVNQEFQDVINEIEMLISSGNFTRLILVGDWNCDFSRNTAHVTYLKNFMSRYNLLNGWDHKNAYPDYTYVNDSLGHKSRIDHFIMSSNTHNPIKSLNVKSNGINVSWHRPIVLEIELQTNQIGCNTGYRSMQSSMKKVAWHKVSDTHVNNYKECLDFKLKNVTLPHDALKCKDVMCKNTSHHNAINKLCNDLILTCIDVSNEVLPHTCPKENLIPFWNEEIEPLRQKSLFWHNIWNECGKPHEGVLANIMRRTRALYHKAVKDARKNDLSLRRCRMAEAICSNNNRDLWDETKKITPTRNLISNNVDGMSNSEDISQVFANKFGQLYQSVPTDNVEINRINDELKYKIMNENSVNECNLTCNDIDLAIRKLNKNKNDGNLGFYSDHLILSTSYFKTSVAMLINCMFIHGYSANDLLVSIITSIPKDVRGNLNSSDNYRGIALCCSLCKVIDYIILNRYSSYLSSSNLQFAFKEEHDTTMCTAMLKETISYFLNNKSNVYVCLLDASKAFDKVHYGKLFRLLIDRKLPAIVIRFLLDNYTRQSIYAAWNGVKSDCFSAKNGVKQGGVLSPILFNIYYDEMICKLKQSNIGCKIGNLYIGALAYADDIVLLCPSRTGLQKMLNICELYSVEYQVSFNAGKTQCIKFSYGVITGSGDLMLNNVILKWEQKVNHLGNILNYNLKDKDDLSKKKGKFVGSVNKLLSNYGNLQSYIVAKLFQAYCCSFYGCTLWSLNEAINDQICVEWNKAVRRVLKLPSMTHTSFLGPLINLTHVSHQFVLRFIKFYHRILDSKNEVVSLMGKICMKNNASYLKKNILYIKWTYGFNIADFDFNQCRKYVKDKCKVEPDVLAYVDVLKELLDVRDGKKILDDVSRDEITEWIICTSTCEM